MKLRPLIAFAVATLLSASVNARDVKVGATSITLSPPQGYCSLDASNTADAKMLAAVEGMLGRTGNRLLLLSADCGQLADWRTGKRQLLDNMAQHQSLIKLENARLSATPEATIEQACARLRKQGEQMVTDMTADVQERADKILKSVKLNEMKFLGVLGEEPRVCYAALLQRFLTEVGTEKTQVAVFATTIVRGKVLYYYLFAPYVSGETLSSMLQQHKANVQRLRRDNGE
jgi:hypothetical protein